MPASFDPAMAPKVIRYADQPDTPWANGHGSTRLLWTDPDGARRISVARLSGPAAFSALPGMARVLAVLDPIRISLNLSGQKVQLGQHDILHFSGEEPVELLTLDQPGRVLNVMALATRWTPHLSGTANPPPFAWVALRDANHCEAPLCCGDMIFSAQPVPQALGVHFQPVHLKGQA